MKKIKGFLGVILILVLIVSLTGCGGAEKSGEGNEEVIKEEKKADSNDKNENNNEDNKKEDKKTIGFSVWTMEWEFFQNMEEGIENVASDYDYEVVLHDQKGDETQMVSGCESLIAQGVDALIISPCRPEALGPIVEKAHASDIPVLICDIGGGGSNYDAIVVSDNYGGGQMAAEYALGLLDGTGSKEVALITNSPSAVYGLRRTQGAKDYAEANGYKVVKELCGKETTENGYAVMKDILVSNPNVEAIFCGNDSMAAGAAQAMKDAGRDDILITGFDATEQGVTLIKEGLITCTIQQFPYDMGARCVMLADTLLKGGEIEYDNEDAREVFANIKLITKDEADNIKKSMLE